jgi:hypothetical protein
MLWRRQSCFVTWVVLAAALGSACNDRSVGHTGDSSTPDGSAPDAGVLSCDPEPNQLGCVQIVFPEQQTAFSQAEAAAGIGFVWELVVPGALDEVYAFNQDPACCPSGVGPLRARETVSGNQQYYCDCDHGLCDPTGCENPPAIQLAAGRTTQTFEWPGVNWYGPSDTGNPYGLPFPRGEYTVRVQASGQWRPPWGTGLVSYSVTGQLQIEILDGCGDGPAVESALWTCTGGVGEGGLCVDLTVDDTGEPVGWVPEWPLDPVAVTCLNDALMNDCFPSLAGTTEQFCIYGI